MRTRLGALARGSRGASAWSGREELVQKLARDVLRIDAGRHPVVEPRWRLEERRRSREQLGEYLHRVRDTCMNFDAEESTRRIVNLANELEGKSWSCRANEIGSLAALGKLLELSRPREAESFLRKSIERKMMSESAVEKGLHRIFKYFLSSRRPEESVLVASRWYRNQQVHGGPALVASTKSINCILESCIKEKNANAALSAVEQMISQDRALESSTCAKLIQCFVRAGAFSQVDKLLKQMRERGTRITTSIIEQLINSSNDEHSLNEAVHFKISSLHSTSKQNHRHTRDDISCRNSNNARPLHWSDFLKLQSSKQLLTGSLGLAIVRAYVRIGQPEKAMAIAYAHLDSLKLKDPTMLNLLMQEYACRGRYDIVANIAWEMHSSLLYPSQKSARLLLAYAASSTASMDSKRIMSIWHQWVDPSPKGWIDLLKALKINQNTSEVFCRELRNGLRTLSETNRRAFARKALRLAGMNLSSIGMQDVNKTLLKPLDVMLEHLQPEETFLSSVLCHISTCRDIRAGNLSKLMVGSIIRGIIPGAKVQRSLFNMCDRIIENRGPLLSSSSHRRATGLLEGHMVTEGTRVETYRSIIRVGMDPLQEEIFDVDIALSRLESLPSDSC